MQSEHPMNRRGFLKTVGAGLAAGSVLSGRQSSARADVQRVNTIGKVITHKAVGIGMVKGDAPIMAKFKLLKELGFDGVEWTAEPAPLANTYITSNSTSLETTVIVVGSEFREGSIGDYPVIWVLPG